MKLKSYNFQVPCLRTPINSNDNSPTTNKSQAVFSKIRSNWKKSLSARNSPTNESKRENIGSRSIHMMKIPITNSVIKHYQPIKLQNISSLSTTPSVSTNTCKMNERALGQHSLKLTENQTELNTKSITSCSQANNDISLKKKTMTLHIPKQAATTATTATVTSENSTKNSANFLRKRVRSTNENVSEMDRILSKRLFDSNLSSERNDIPKTDRPPTTHQKNDTQFLTNSMLKEQHNQNSPQVAQDKGPLKALAAERNWFQKIQFTSFDKQQCS